MRTSPVTFTVFSAEVYPIKLTVRVTVPLLTPLILKLPLASVEVLVPVPLIDTEAPGSVFLDSSVTRPLILPVCAVANKVANRNKPRSPSFMK